MRTYMMRLMPGKGHIFPWHEDNKGRYYSVGVIDTYVGGDLDGDKLIIDIRFEDVKMHGFSHEHATELQAKLSEAFPSEKQVNRSWLFENRVHILRMQLRHDKNKITSVNQVLEFLQSNHTPNAALFGTGQNASPLFNLAFYDEKASAAMEMAYDNSLKGYEPELVHLITESNPELIGAELIKGIKSEINGWFTNKSDVIDVLGDAVDLTARAATVAVDVVLNNTQKFTRFFGLSKAKPASVSPTSRTRRQSPPPGSLRTQLIELTESYRNKRGGDTFWGWLKREARAFIGFEVRSKKYEMVERFETAILAIREPTVPELTACIRTLHAFNATKEGHQLELEAHVQDTKQNKPTDELGKTILSMNTKLKMQN